MMYAHYQRKIKKTCDYVGNIEKNEFISYLKNNTGLHNERTHRQAIGRFI